MIQLAAPGAKQPPPVQPKRRGGARGPVFIASNLIVLAWLVVSVALLIAHDLIDHPIWLAVHALLLGAATNAIIIWSGHFTTTLCRVPDRPEWHLAAKMVALNIAVVAALIGVWVNAEWLTGAAGGIVAVIAAAHGAELISMKKAALSARFDYLVDFYLAAVAALLVGAVVGATMAFGVNAWYARQWATHVHIMLFGWIGLTVVGTLFTLWPTTNRERITPRSYGLAHRTLPSLAAGLGIIVVGLLAANLWLTVVGFLCYTVGVGVAVVALWPQRKPVGPASWMLVGATVWLGVGVLVELIGLLVTRSVDTLPGLVESAVIPLLVIGFVAQVLMGALTELLPVLTAHGPGQRKAVINFLERGWYARLFMLNIAVPLVAAPLPNQIRLVGWAFGAIAVAGFLWLALQLIIPVLTRGEIIAKTVEPKRRGAMTVGIAVAGLVAVVLSATLGAGRSSSGAVSKTGGPVQTIDVTLNKMRVMPDRLEVPAGTHLVLRVTNDEAIPHDLRDATGARTPRLNRGQSALMDLGVVDEDRDIWCDVPGHKAAGMTMTVIAVGGKHHAAQHSGGHGGHGDGESAVAPLNLATDPSADWTPTDAALKPAESGTHRVELHAVDQELEVAPGRKELRWTWGGTEPGPILHGHVGDKFEITLINDSHMGHGMDFHAGPLAPDGPMRTLAPGERMVYRFTAPRAGIWFYHCSSPPISLHIANGMYGAVIIDPPGLAPVAKEYVLVGAQLYLGDPHSDDKPEAIRADRPDGWMYNGMAAQYNYAPLPARVGERVRVWVVNAGPGDTIAFHVIGAQFDTVYREGAYLLRPGSSTAPDGGSQVLDLAPAQGGFVELTFPEVGNYPFMDHDMRHAESGAHGIFKVDG